jgi:hypothetical protein
MSAKRRRIYFAPELNLVLQIEFRCRVSHIRFVLEIRDSNLGKGIMSTEAFLVLIKHKLG